MTNGQDHDRRVVALQEPADRAPAVDAAYPCRHRHPRLCAVALHGGAWIDPLLGDVVAGRASRRRGRATSR